MALKHPLRRLLRRAGYDVVRFGPRTNALAARIHCLRSLQVDTVIDVGANVGQFASHMRKDIGYRGRIVSFEPLAAAFRELQKRASGDADWRVYNYALGARDDSVDLHVTANSFSSSIRAPLPGLVAIEADCRPVERQRIRVRTLDSVFDEVCGDAGSVYLKIDTQGFEKQVIDGAERVLRCIHTVQMEMSLVPLYDGEPLFDGLCKLMAERGFGLMSLEPAFVNPSTGQMLQVDGLFHRLTTPSTSSRVHALPRNERQGSG